MRMTLDDLAAVDIVEQNIHAVAAIYAASVMEELKLFAVVDRVVEAFMSGMLPIESQSAKKALLDLKLNRSGRFLSEAERKAIYTGTVGGSGDVTSNTEFGSLWLGFLSAVSSFRRFRKRTRRMRAAEEAVRKAGRDLAANLSLRGAGQTQLAAGRLAAHVRAAVSILRNEEVRSAYGARDAWQVVDRVAHLDLGGAPDIPRLRARAQAGDRIVRLIARYHHAWRGRRRPPLLPVVGASGALITATDWRSLRRSVNEWLNTVEPPATDTGPNE
jgi:hypothetical protein